MPVIVEATIPWQRLSLYHRSGAVLMRHALVLVCLTIPAFAHAESGAEAAFKQAREWTVLVRTSVDRAFVEDEQGSFEGSGLVIDPVRGWVLTNAHVASYSYSANTVAFAKGPPLPARRLYVDPYLDAAILAYDVTKVVPQPPQPTLDCDEVPAVGHPVGAFGHPWGFRFTGTRGIASALTTRFGPAMLQTDAPINTGNSGGPLISLETGAVVGINAASVRKDQSEGLGFAVPMIAACRIIDLLKGGGDPSPPASLVDFAVDEDNERTLLIARSRLPPGTLDLRAGDEIVSVGPQQTPIASESALVGALRGKLDAVTLQVQRDGRRLSIQGRWPPAARITDRRGLWISGALFADARNSTTAQLADAPALMVHHVEPGSDAENSDVATFDWVISVDGAAIRSLDDLERAALRARKAARPLDFMLLRLGSEDEPELFLHQRRRLTADDVEPIGPAAH